jgi:hypothetical protein
VLQRKLMERNVAEEIAGKVVDSVAQSLEGQKLSSFTGGFGGGVFSFCCAFSTFSVCACVVAHACNQPPQELLSGAS